MLVLAVDPGVRGCGVALFKDGELVWAEYVVGLKNGERAVAWNAMVTAVAERVTYIDQLVIELPQVYVRARSKGDPNDLITLATVVGGLCHAFKDAPCPAKVYLPAEWKGQVPKEIMHKRAVERLSESECARIKRPAKSLLHNVLDGVSLGLTFLGRLDR